MGSRAHAKKINFHEILPEELENELKSAAEISMGTEVSDEDIDNIKDLCEQVISISEYREQLYEYLKNRMAAIAPNLTVLVGELVGARLIAHAGSLLNLSKHPASTVQILGAEKALFRALKTKHETPKYGLIYHASLIGQAPPKHKGKISRVLAAKAALAIRYDALGEEALAEPSVGIDGREKVERRIRQLDAGVVHKISGTGKGKPQMEKYKKDATTSYKTKNDSTIGMEVEETKEEVEEEKPQEKKQKKEKKEKKEKKKDKKRKRDSTNGDGEQKKKPKA
jgi:nucleolar protein 58